MKERVVKITFFEGVPDAAIDIFFNDIAELAYEASPDCVVSMGPWKEEDDNA